MKKDKVDDGQSEFMCDGCGKDAFGQLYFHFWYGSKNDMTAGGLHLCDNCADKTLHLLTKEFAVKDFLKPIIEI